MFQIGYYYLKVFVYNICQMKFVNQFYYAKTVFLIGHINFAHSMLLNFVLLNEKNKKQQNTVAAQTALPLLGLTICIFSVIVVKFSKYFAKAIYLGCMIRRP